MKRNTTRPTTVTFAPMRVPKSGHTRFRTVAKTVLGIFKLSLEISQTPAGRELGTWNIPGAWLVYVNVLVALGPWTILNGHVKLI